MSAELESEAKRLPKRYVLLELTDSEVGREPLYQWDWSRMLGVEARPLAISQKAGLADIQDALTHEY